MKSNLYKASSRGHFNHGWLDTYHTFSFAGYNNPERINFGALRVLNDDIVAGGEGFGKHPHDNMEIVSIPINGALAHRDSMGHKEVISTGEVQVMSAGRGIFHSEYNADAVNPVNFFQIWIFPNKENVSPRYEQKAFGFTDEKNKLFEIVSPDQNSNNLWLNQDAWLNIGTFDKSSEIDYKIRKTGNGVFAIVIDGEFMFDKQALGRRDAIGIWDTENIKLETVSNIGKILLIEVPMNVS